MVKKSTYPQEKRGVSLMLSYVLLISLALLMAVTIYSSLKLIANVKPVSSCESGTSTIITSYSCVKGILGSPSLDPVFELNLTNNGLFSTHGIIIAISDDDKKVPVVPVNAKYLPNNRGDGIYLFAPSLDPDKTQTAQFNVNNFSQTSTAIKQVRIQPFIINEKNDLVSCSDAVFVEKLPNCTIL